MFIFQILMIYPNLYILYRKIHGVKLVLGIFKYITHWLQITSRYWEGVRFKYTTL